MFKIVLFLTLLPLAYTLCDNSTCVTNPIVSDEGKPKELCNETNCVTSSPIDEEAKLCNNKTCVTTLAGDGLKNPEFKNNTSVTSPIEAQIVTCELTSDQGLKNCIRKCCPAYHVRSRRTCVFMPDRDILAKEGVKMYTGRMLKRVVPLSQLAVLMGYKCKEKYLEDEGILYLQEDGKLQVFVPGAWLNYTFNPDQYCLETFVDPKGITPDKVDALICMVEEQGKTRRPWFAVCMLTSCVFILATLIVYAWIPELQNMHGRVLMCYLTCLLVSFISLTSLQMIQENEVASTALCFYLGLVVYTSLIATFFWLNVMCFDIYWTFSGRRGLSLEKLSLRNRFLAYCAYAFGTPLIMTALLLILQYSAPKNPFMPNLDCFLYGIPKYIYFYGPLLVLCVMNMIFFIMTAVKIFRVKKQTSVLQSGESATHDQQRDSNDKHRYTYRMRFLLYIKLFIVMGVNWILEIVSSFFDQNAVIFMITDCFNLLIGVTIFILFVCKKKIYHLIKKRYRQLRGQPMSRQTTTTTSTRTMNKDEIQMTTKNGH